MKSQLLESTTENNNSTSFISFDSDQTYTEVLIGNEDSAEKDHRTVSRSLKRFIHKDFDYNSFLHHIKELQNKCSLYIYGLTQAI